MKLTPDHHDLVCELLNIGVGRAAASLNALIDSHVSLSVPDVKMVHVKDLESAAGNERISSIMMAFEAEFSGVSSLVFHTEGALRLASLLLCSQDESSLSLDALQMGALCEVGNILLNAVMGSIGNVLSSEISYAIPEYWEGSISSMVEKGLDSVEGYVLMAEMEFGVAEHRIKGSVLFYFEIGSYQPFCDALDRALFGETKIKVAG